ncbi:TPA: hypothetical protein ACH3X1_003676 [Trebouxia sp. C0004]
MPTNASLLQMASKEGSAGNRMGDNTCTTWSTVVTCMMSMPQSPTCHQSWHAFHNNLDTVQDDLLSDPMTADKMFVEVKVSANKVRWTSIRGSSKLVGFHKNANTVLSSGQTGAKLAAALYVNFWPDGT